MHGTLAPGRRFAFTLVELLVVIGIIGLLISILLPSLSKARAAADSAKCASTLRQFMNADAMYVADYHSFHIPAYCEWNPTATPTLSTTGGPASSNIWTGNLAFRKYLKFREWHYAAGDTTDYPVVTDFPGTTTAFNNSFLPAGFVCPAATRLLTNVVSDKWGQQWFPVITQYGMNVQGLYSTATFKDPQDGTTKTNSLPYTITRTATPPGDGVFAYKASKVRNSADKLFIVDAMTGLGMVDASGSGVGAPNGDVTKGTGGKLSNYDIVQEHTGSGTIAGYGAYNASMMTVWRHRGGANVAFFDGHVAWLRKDEIYSVDPSTGKIGIRWSLWKPMDQQ